MSTQDETHSAFDPARRRLCPDGTCIGLLDDGGRCKVCGRTAGGAPAGAAAPAADTAGLPSEEADSSRAETDEADEPGGPSAFDASRKLCPDGSCVGVVGPNSRCKICGRAEEA